MAANVRQKVVKLVNNAQLVAMLNNYLNLGYVVHQVINLAPASNELLIFYYDPSVDEIVNP